MAKRSRKGDKATQSKRFKEGRGQGRGSDYMPWLHIQDVPSQGLASRINGWKTSRVHHFLSELEVRYFYALEWANRVSDIREQFPLLPLEETLSIADACGFRHPIDPKTQEPVVMTSDFIITLRQGVGFIEQIRTIKPAADLRSTRTLEKLEIERQYWQRRGLDWRIVTEREIPTTLTDNVKWLHPYRHIEELEPLTVYEVQRITSFLTPLVISGKGSLVKLTATCDDRLGLTPGSSLSVVRYLLANRQWEVDMACLLQPKSPLVLVNKAAAIATQPIGG
ncbi:MAG: TnsA endonuclease N-terminal domain-containing protein [Cyanobacteria bacterium P01_H01_bin.153]